MALYIVRPYFGHDCDSEMGFNNGHYLDPIVVDAECPEGAACIAMRAFTDQLDADEREVWTREESPFDNYSLYRETDHVWRRGDEESETEPEDDGNGDWEVFYRYQYIDFGADVRLAGDDD